MAKNSDGGMIVQEAYPSAVLSGNKTHINLFRLNFDSYDYRAICLFFALLMYALLGSPTPDSFSWREMLIGVLLALSVGIGRFRDAVFHANIIPPARPRLWKTAGQVFMIYGFFVPVIMAVLNGHEIRSILRDFIPFLFLFLPLFLLPLIRARPYYFRSTLVAVVIIGFLFSIRSIIMRYANGCAIWCSDELLYLENMPTVLFSALFLLGVALHYLVKEKGIKSIAFCTIFMGLSLVPIVSMILTLQRASLGAVFIYLAIISAYFIYKKPSALPKFFMFCLVSAYFIGIVLHNVYEPLLDKTDSVGLNMRPQEFYAVWDVVGRDIFTFLFGAGWGAEFQSPAVGNLRVNFTHNFFSSVFLKTGCIGLLLSIAYILCLLERLGRVILKNLLFGLALAAPILIDLTLYASFKSLDFGIMLLMISGSLVYFRQSESHSV